MFKGISKAEANSEILNTVLFMELSRLTGGIRFGKPVQGFSVICCTSSLKKTGLKDGLSLPTLDGGEDSAVELKDPFKLELKLIDVGRWAIGGGD